MAHAEFHTGTPRHPKILGLSDGAFRLWFNSVCYCKEHLTDGRVPKTIVASLKARVTPRLVAELTTITAPGYSSPLWEDSGDYYQVHDFCYWNDRKDDVQKNRTALKERQRRYRERKAAEAAGPSVTPPVTPPVTPNGNASRNALQDALVTQGTRIRTRTPDPNPVLDVTGGGGGGPETVWEEWRHGCESYLSRPVPLTLTTKEFDYCKQLAARYPDPEWRGLLLDVFMRTQNDEIRAKPKTLGWFVHWAQWIDEQLRAKGRRPAIEAVA